MNILVCLKQVPDTAKVKFNRETNTLDRTGVENIMNPYDRQALEVALCLKDKEGAKVTVLTMGLPQATDILKEAIAMGADDGVLLSDRVLGGSDTLATSLALAAAVKHLGEFDLVLCGKQAVDGDTAQVGLACAAPLLVTVTKSEKEPRFASIKGKMKARKAQIPTLTVADLDIDPATVGLKGSPTKVKKAFTPTPPEINGEIITEADADAAVDMLFEKLVKAEVITR